MRKQIDKQKIYDYLTTIPQGKVVTYGQLAELYAFGGINAQREKLEADCIVVEGNKVDLNRYGW